MGRKTLESLPKQKPLPGRTNLVLTRDADYRCDDAIVLHSAEEVFHWLREHRIPPEKVFVSGGAEIYRLFIPYCQTAYLTRIDHRFGADRFIDNLEQDRGWLETARSDKQKENGYRYEWITYQRINE